MSTTPRTEPNDPMTWEYWRDHARKSEMETYDIKAQLTAKEQELAEARALRDRLIKRICTAVGTGLSDATDVDLSDLSLARIISERDEARQQLTARDATIEGLREAHLKAPVNRGAGDMSRNY